jgi:hypothetical protein
MNKYRKALDAFLERDRRGTQCFNEVADYQLIGIEGRVAFLNDRLLDACNVLCWTLGELAKAEDAMHGQQSDAAQAGGEK